MSDSWTSKDKRQYDHIKEEALNRCKPRKKAAEIAAKTVNKTRRQAGKTINKTSMGTGNPYKSLDDRTTRELYNRAKQLDIPQRSKMNKADLIAAIRSQY